MLCLLALLAAPIGEPSELVVAGDLPLMLVAEEPVVVDPVAIRFDADGRLWVVEMPDYPTGPVEGQPPTGRIKTLHDEDGDGTYDRAVVFADSLLIPTGVQPLGSGAIVTLAGEVAFLDDTDGDGHADTHETWIKGLATDNEQLRANHPTIGPDGWIYIANGLRTIDVQDARTFEGSEPAEPAAVRGRDFRFRLDRPGIEPVNGHGQFGMTFDRWGNRFVCSNARPIDYAVFTTADLARNPLLRNPLSVDEVVPGGQSRPVHPLVSQWTTSIVHEGSFTAACGVHVHGSPLIPLEQNEEAAFICEPTGSLVHAETIRPDGASFAGSPYPADAAFLASTDPWFRPVDLTEGPDGCLYVVDMHRKVIEHPHWMPEEDRVRSDFESGRGMGRIYRVGTPTPRDASIGPVAQLTTARNGWAIAAARQRLAEAADSVMHRQDLRAAAINWSLPPDGRLRARQWLAGLDALDADLTDAALRHLTATVANDADNLLKARPDEVDLITPTSRELAGTMRVSPRVPPRTLIATDEGSRVWLRKKLQKSADPAVRFRSWFLPLSSSQPSFNAHDSMPRDIRDRWMRQAALLNVRVDAGSLERLLSTRTLARLFQRSIAADRDDRVLYLEFVRDLARLAVAKTDDADAIEAHARTIRLAIELVAQNTGQMLKTLPGRLAEGPDDLNQLPKQIDRAITRLEGPQPFLTYVMLGLADAGHADRLPTHPDDRPRAPRPTTYRHTALADDQWEIVADQARPLPIRAAAVELLAYLAEDAADLMPVIDLGVPQLRRQALIGFRQQERLGIPDSLLLSLPHLGPADRDLLLDAALRTDDRRFELLRLIDDGRLDPLLIDANRAERLRQARSPAIAKLAQRLLPEVAAIDEATWQRYADAVHPSAGDIERGLAVFRKNCANCHRVGTEGGTVGPDLSDLRTKKRLQLLEAILKPNAAIDAAYLGYVARTETGRVVTGVITAESDAAVTLRGSDGRDTTLLRDEFEGFKTTGQSLMPTGMERAIDPESMSDLIHYLKAWRYE